MKKKPSRKIPPGNLPRKKLPLKRPLVNRQPENVNDASSIVEPEGLDEDRELGDFPIDTLLIRNEQRTVFEIVRRIDAGGYIMDPEFQRDFVWEPDRQSKLIESVVMRIPLPVFYLAENDEGEIIVVDGLQRLTTFQNFLNNRFKLKLPEQALLNGKRFQDLSPKLQNRIEDCNLILYILDANVPDHAKFQIFKRVNGGVPLTRQQMRNCLYSGPATRWLKDEAATELFLETTGKSLDAKKMRDRELINRFCAFYLIGEATYTKGDMDDFLADALREMNDASETQLSDLSSAFRKTLSLNADLFGRHAFRKHSPGQDSRSILNAALWDVMTTGLARYSKSLVIERAQVLRSGFYELLKDERFNRSITYGPNSAKMVYTRFSMANELFKEVLGDYKN